MTAPESQKENISKKDMNSELTSTLHFVCIVKEHSCSIVEEVAGFNGCSAIVFTVQQQNVWPRQCFM
jgi:hypothetical protein